MAVQTKTFAQAAQNILESPLNPLIKVCRASRYKSIKQRTPSEDGLERDVDIGSSPSSLLELFT